uniref:Fanconi-associated nuclease n=1 Tax=Meloidogyne incognita TaxID=6306 RepID=A0A914MXK7_MELIC
MGGDNGKVPYFLKILKKIFFRIFQFINLPVYLRKFSPPWIYCRCIFRGVEAAQRLRDYELAVNWLIFLLSKEELKHFCINSRGRWYKRLVLNLNKHLKRNEEASKFCCLGIEDNFVLVSDKLSLQERLDKLSQRVVDCPQALLKNRLVLDEPEKVCLNKKYYEFIDLHFPFPLSPLINITEWTNKDQTYIKVKITQILFLVLTIL